MRHTVLGIAALISCVLTAPQSPPVEDTFTVPYVQGTFVNRTDFCRPFYLYVDNPKFETFAPVYLKSDGLTASGPKLANAFKLTTIGQLATVSTEDDWATRYLSTNQGIPWMSWSMSLSLQEIYTTFSLKSTDNGQLLVWQDKRLKHATAKFCQLGSEIKVVFDGTGPEGCQFVNLFAVREK